MDIELAKALYFRELDRRKDLDDAPTFRVAVLAILGGIFTYYAQRFDPGKTALEWIYFLASAGAIVFSSMAVVWIIRSYARFTWQYLPYARQLLDHYRTLVEYDQTYSLSPSDPAKTFSDHLVERLVEASTRNASNNNQRSELIYWASVFLSVAVIFTLLAGIPVLDQALREMVLK